VTAANRLGYLGSRLLVIFACRCPTMSRWDVGVRFRGLRDLGRPVRDIASGHTGLTCLCVAWLSGWELWLFRLGCRDRWITLW